MINLLPWRQELKARQKKQWMVVLILVAVIHLSLIVGAHLLVDGRIKWQNHQNVYLQQEIDLVEQRGAHIQVLNEQKQQLLVKAQVISELQSSRSQVVRLWNSLAELVPAGLYLNSVLRSGPHVLMEGKALSNHCISTFMHNLETSWLGDIQLTLMQAQDNEEKKDLQPIQFKLQATLR